MKIKAEAVSILIKKKKKTLPVFEKTRFLLIRNVRVSAASVVSVFWGQVFCVYNFEFRTRHSVLLTKNLDPCEVEGRWLVSYLIVLTYFILKWQWFYLTWKLFLRFFSVIHFYVVLRLQPRASHMLVKCFTTELQPHSWDIFNWFFFMPTSLFSFLRVLQLFHSFVILLPFCESFIFLKSFLDHLIT